MAFNGPSKSSNPIDLATSLSSSFGLTTGGGYSLGTCISPTLSLCNGFIPGSTSISLMESTFYLFPVESPFY